MTKIEFLERTSYEVSQTVTISYRGSLAEHVCAINCKAEREDFFRQIVRSDFASVICYWESPANLVIGRIDDIGLFFPDW